MYIVPSFFALKNWSMNVIFAIIVRKIAIFHQFFTPIFVHEMVEIIVTHAKIVAHAEIVAHGPWATIFSTGQR